MKKTYQLPLTDIVVVQLKGSTLDVDNQDYSDTIGQGDANSSRTFEDETIEYGSSTSLWDE